MQLFPFTNYCADPAILVGERLFGPYYFHSRATVWTLLLSIAPLRWNVSCELAFIQGRPDRSETGKPGASFSCVVQQADPKCVMPPLAFTAFINLPSNNTAKETSLSKSGVPDCTADPADFSNFKTVQNRKKLKKGSNINRNYLSKTVGKTLKSYKTVHSAAASKLNSDNNHSSKFWKTSPKQFSNIISKKVNLSSNSPKNKIIVTDEDTSHVHNYPASKKAEVLATDEEMSTSSAPEDILEYNISEELEETSSDVSTPSPPPPKATKQKLKYIIPTKYKNV
ncbi:hypothetical protein HNY73_006484 [Argiope bruennichi]|uniref:Uncharacterized protein n=1 Tax=Argiope bruennichi TaxID=94029 RepID=A0A8T0FK91_ARGBR|nr:hypothetical protein HNY73_006484 [Argiope bruennichi]